ncbi:hypothetical protein JMJ77_0003323, partial [Colletotrichum scovillei]
RAGRGDPQRRTVGRRVFPFLFVFILEASIEELWEVQKQWQVDEKGLENKKGRDRIRRVWRRTHILYHRRHHDAYLLLAFSCFLFCFLFFTSTNLLRFIVQHSYHTAVLVSLPFFSLERALCQYIESLASENLGMANTPIQILALTVRGRAEGCCYLFARLP